MPGGRKSGYLVGQSGGRSGHTTALVVDRNRGLSVREMGKNTVYFQNLSDFMTHDFSRTKRRAGLIVAIGLALAAWGGITLLAMFVFG